MIRTDLYQLHSISQLHFSWTNNAGIRSEVLVRVFYNRTQDTRIFREVSLCMCGHAASGCRDFAFKFRTSETKCLAAPFRFNQTLERNVSLDQKVGPKPTNIPNGLWIQTRHCVERSRGQYLNGESVEVCTWWRSEFEHCGRKQRDIRNGFVRFTTEHFA